MKRRSKMTGKNMQRQGAPKKDKGDGRGFISRASGKLKTRPLKGKRAMTATQFLQKKGPPKGRPA